ncbi:MAG: PAS domain S-box protein [Cyanobacteriota bacterium]
MESNPQHPASEQGSLSIPVKTCGVETSASVPSSTLRYFPMILQGLTLGTTVWQLSDPRDPTTFYLIYANSAAAQLVGFDLTTQLGQRMVDLFPEVESRGILQLYTDILRSGQPWEGEDLTYGDGQVAESIFQVKVLPLDECTICTIYENATAKKQLEQERLALYAQEHTAREQAQAAEAQITAILESITDGFFLVDSEWNFTYLNPQAEPLLGRSREELLGKNIWEEFPEAVGSIFYQQYHRAKEEQTRVSFEALYAPLGKVFAVQAYPLQDGLGAYFQDVTSYKETEAALRKNQQRFQLIAQATNDAIWDWDLSTGRVEWNQGISNLFGYDISEIEPTVQWWSDRIHPEDREWVVEDIHQTIEQGSLTWELQYRFLRADGSFAYVSDRAYILKDEQGKPIHLLGGMTDLSKQIEAQTLLAQQKEQYRCIFEATTDGLLIFNEAGILVEVNPAACTLYGYPYQEFIGLSGLQLLPLEEQAKFEEFLQAVATRSPFESESRHQRKDGTSILVIMSGRSFSLQGETYFLMAVRDITEKKQLEEQFFRAQRLESIGTLAGGIAHDLNNVLTPILMAAKLLRLNVRDERSLRWLDSMENSAQRGAELIKQVLSFARGIEGERIELQLTHIVREIVQIIQETFPRSIQIQTAMDPRETWLVLGDPTQLHQVLMNLCVNARDAMPEGGKIQITVENFFIDENYVRVHIDAKVGPYVVLSISDSGSGIPPEIQEKIFEPFFTTKPLGQGTGLGLSTVLGIIKSHGGFINVYSEVGQGSQFKVYLPAVENAITIAYRDQQRELPRGQGELILLVDDEPAIRELTRSTLEHFGYRVIVASEGTEAIVQFAQYQKEVALALVDMMMPIMDGTQTIRALLQMQPDLKIIAVSGLMSNGHAAALASGKVKAFLTKPHTAEELLTTLHHVLGSEGSS